MFCDIHNHTLPGVDDGAQTLDDSLMMIDQALDSGISTICCTPHLKAYASEEERQNRHVLVFEALHNEVEKRGIDIRLELGCELYYTSEFATLATQNVFTYAKKSKAVLVELPPTQAPHWFADLCFPLILQGITVLLAHPERNIALMSNPSILAQYVNSGIKTQVTSGSITGQFGDEIQEFAMRIVSSGACTIIASDAHNVLRRPFSDTKTAYTIIAEKFGTKLATTLFTTHPLAILDGTAFSSNELREEMIEKLVKQQKKKRFYFF